MRKEPLIFKEQSDQGTGAYQIMGLNLIEPFGSLVWGSYQVYTTPSLAPSVRTKGNYIYCYQNSMGGGNSPLVCPERSSCLGFFYELMSDNEKAEFRENILDIYDIMRLN